MGLKCIYLFDFFNTFGAAEASYEHNTHSYCTSQIHHHLYDDMSNMLANSCLFTVYSSYGETFLIYLQLCFWPHHECEVQYSLFWSRFFISTHSWGKYLTAIVISNTVTAVRLNQSWASGQKNKTMSSKWHFCFDFSTRADNGRWCWCTCVLYKVEVSKMPHCHQHSKRA